MHQRDDMHIFSPVPLEAYDEIQNDNTAFLILGGSSNHRKQAKDYELINVKFLIFVMSFIIFYLHLFFN